MRISFGMWTIEATEPNAWRQYGSGGVGTVNLKEEIQQLLRRDFDKGRTTDTSNSEITYKPAIKDTAAYHCTSENHLVHVSLRIRDLSA
jgi:hypothetical protein